MSMIPPTTPPSSSPDGAGDGAGLEGWREGAVDALVGPEVDLGADGGLVRTEDRDADCDRVLVGA